MRTSGFTLSRNVWGHIAGACRPSTSDCVSKPANLPEALPGPQHTHGAWLYSPHTTDPRLSGVSQRCTVALHMCRRFGTSPKSWTLLVRAAPNAPAADSWGAPASQMVEKLSAPESLKAFVLQKIVCSAKRA